MQLARSAAPLVLALIGAMSSPAALAEEVFDGPLVQVLPYPHVVADGKTPATVHLIARQADGSALTGFEAKLKAKNASDPSWTDLGDGLYAITFTPDYAEAGVEVPLKIRLKGPDKEKATFDITVDADKPPVLGMQGSVSPARITQGTDQEGVLVTFALADTEARLTPDQLLLRTSLGELSDVAVMGEGQFTVRLTVPKLRDPALALITASDARAPENAYAAVAVPVDVPKDVWVRGARKADVLVTSGGREYGPITLSSKGSGKVALVAVPGGDVVEQVTVVDGAPESSELDLQLKPFRRVQFLPPPIGVPADPEVTMPVRVVVFQPDGTPDGEAALQVDASAGSLSEPLHEGAGIYRLDWTPEVRSEVEDLTLTVTLEGEERVQKDTVTVRTVPPRARAVTLTADPDPLGDARQVTFTAAVEGPEGPLPGLPLFWYPIGMSPEGEPQDRGDGTYTHDWKTYGGPVECIVAPGTWATGNPVERVVLLPSRPATPADGVSGTLVRVLTLDGDGYPVAEVPVTLALLQGEAKLPTKVTTDASGMGQVFLTAGRKPGLLRMRATVGAGNAERFTEIAMVQGVVDLGVARLPVSGTPADVATVSAWTDLVTRTGVAK